MEIAGIDNMMYMELLKRIKTIFYVLVSIAWGCWWFPFGMIFALGSIYRNLRGGTDVTEEVLKKINDSMKN